MVVTKMGNSVPRAGIATTFLAFLASVLTITPPRLPKVSMPTTDAYLYMEILAREISADYYTHPPGIVSLLVLMLTIMYSQTAKH